MEVRYSVSVDLNETQPFLRVVTLSIAFGVAPSGVVQAGVVVSKSDTGCGMLSIQLLALLRTRVSWVQILPGAQDDQGLSES